MTPLEHLEALFHWVAIPSLSGDEIEFTDWLEALLQDDGMTVRRVPTPDGRSNLLASFDPNPSLLFCSHLDTVPPYISPRIQGKTLYGRGSCDAKGPIYAMRQALLSLKRGGVQGAGLLLLVSEETDHSGAKAAKAAGIRCDTLIVGEPTRNRFLPAQKGTLKVCYHAKGKAGHSAFPERGKSAIHTLVQELDRVLTSPLPSDPQFGPTTVNVGRIEGGVADNVFAPKAQANAFFRTTVPATQMLKPLRDEKRADIKIEKLAATDPLPFAVPSWADPGEVAAFNTDAPYMKGRFQRCYLMGPGDIRNAHSKDERITASELVKAAQLYERVAKDHLA